MVELLYVNSYAAIAVGTTLSSCVFKRDDWVYTTRWHSTDAAFSKRSCNEVTSVYLWTRPDKISTVKAAALISHSAVSQSMKDKSRSKGLSGVNYADPAFSPDPLSNLNFLSSKQKSASTTPRASPGHPTVKKRRPRVKEYMPPPPPSSPALPERTTADISTASSTINSPSFKNSSSSSLRPHPAAPSASSSPSSSFVPHVHARADMPQNAHHHTLFRRHSHHTSPPPKPEHKNRHGFLSKIFGSSNSESSESTTSSNSSPPPPSNNKRHTSMRVVPQSPSLPHDRAQPAHQLRIANPSPEMSMLEDPPRPAMARTAAEAVRVMPVVAAPPPVDDQWMHQDLDRIDELDESNPFGGAIHNGGPYEAVPRFVHRDLNPKPHMKPPQIQQNSDRGSMMSGDVYRNAQIMALKKGTLNLKPGQVLPRKLVPRVEISHHPYPQPDSPPQRDRHYDHHPRHTHAQPGEPIRDGRPPLEQSGPIPRFPSVPEANLSRTRPSSSITDSRSNNQGQTPSPAPTFIQYENQDSGFAIGMAMVSADENISHPTNGTTITENNPEFGSSTNMPTKNVVKEPTIDERMHSPPPYTFEPPILLFNETRYMRTDGSHSQGAAATKPSERGQFVNMPQPSFPETTQLLPRMPSTSSLSRSGTWHPQAVQIPPPHSGPSRREVHSFGPPPLQERITPADPRLHRASTYALNSSGARTDRLALASSLQRDESVLRSSGSPGLRDRESDARSVQQSNVTMSNASRITGSSQTREDYRRNRYLPKQLVMPTPLQPALQNQAAVEQVRFDPRASPVHARDSSPSKRRSILVASPIPRAGDIPVASSGGKLRKRMSLLGGKKEQASPVAAVSFLANIVTSDKNDRGAEKPRKNVLNKRK